MDQKCQSTFIAGRGLYSILRYCRAVERIIAMESSDEIKNIMLRFYDAMTNLQTQTWLDLISQEEGVLCVGTDPNEWIAGYDEFRKYTKSIGPETAGMFTMIPGEIKAYQEGTAGWASDLACWKLPNGKDVPMRVTAVFHKENEEWKFVQWHASIGVPNAEVLG